MRAALFCREAIGLVNRAIDRRLPVGQRIQMHIHLMVCPACRRYRRQAEDLQRLVLAHLRAGAGDGDESLSPQARERIAQVLRRQG